ncbi:hypothetical protein C1637_21030 [Chryseobacterium lactis]|uniref:Uncharacterized protein n=1 Tax=Chryseobacterium lactis TaxID=1241981 RepID=A0A3G6RLI0_CHRLC|nr:hypothetical protein [Chryseobacterium lactis]AZA83443.1 hypothetical protein EG342_16830 [Chryseobacterium lactis]AZB03827.1 hypothetical protein EG341_07705 [Chryseobacterium lactis]PNW11596.1 hypothetical protein C1637_21030 [Chryseobacterium lactis]
MKIVLLSTEINKLEIAIAEIDFPTDPLVGDFIDIIDFMSEEQKLIYRAYCQNEGKSEFANIKRRSWHVKKGDVVMYLHLEHINA